MFQSFNAIEFTCLFLGWTVGLTEVVWALAVLGQLLLVLAIVFRLSLALSPTVVLQRLQLNRGLRRQALPAIEIAGRREGLFAYLLGLVGLSPVFSFKVTALEARIEMSSLLGQRLEIIPLRNISMVTAGTRKPIDALLIGAVLSALTLFASVGLALAGEFTALLFCLLLGTLASAGLFLYYYWGKRFFLRLVSHSGFAIHLAFKPNVIEGVELDLTRVETLVSVVRDLIADAVGSSAGGDVELTGPSGPPQLPASKIRSAEVELDELEEVEPLVDLANRLDPEERAKQMLATAKLLSKSGQRDEAVQMMRDVIETYPRTPAADQARSSLKKHGYL